MDRVRYARVQEIPMGSALSLQGEAKLPSLRSQEPRKSTETNTTVLATWWLECVCLLLMVIALIAVAVTVYKYEGMPQPRWRYSVTVNTLIALYTVIITAAMVKILSSGLSQLKWLWYSKQRCLGDIEYWDQATRGPWGSLCLLWRLRARDLIAILGALTIVLAILLAPLTQLLVQYRTCRILDSGSNATISRRNNFWSTGKRTGALQATIPTDLQNTITGGVMGTNLNTVVPTCASGDCTFTESYRTIGYCSHCTDLVSEVVTSCDADKYRCTYYLPSMHFNYTFGGGPVYLAYVMVNKTSTADSNYTVTIRNPIDTSLKPDFQDCTKKLGDDSWICYRYGAANCSLYPCVKQMNAAVDRGLLHETTTSTFANFEITQNNQLAAIDVPCVRRYPDVVTKLQSDGYVIDSTTDMIGYWGRGRFKNSSSKVAQFGGSNVSVPEPCLYTFSYTAERSIDSYVQGLLTGGQLVPWQFSREEDITFQSISRTFASIANVLTDYTRLPQPNISDPSPPFATGQVYRTETCMYARWPFITYAAALVLSTILFFAATIYRTTSSYNRACDWKDSSLALLFHEVPVTSSHDVQLSLSGIRTRRDFEEKAETMTVKFGGFTQIDRLPSR